MTSRNRKDTTKKLLPKKENPFVLYVLTWSWLGTPWKSPQPWSLFESSLLPAQSSCQDKDSFHESLTQKDPHDPQLMWDAATSCWCFTPFFPLLPSCEASQKVLETSQKLQFSNPNTALDSFGRFHYVFFQALVGTTILSQHNAACEPTPYLSLRGLLKKSSSRNPELLILHQPRGQTLDPSSRDPPTPGFPPQTSHWKTGRIHLMLRSTPRTSERSLRCQSRTISFADSFEVKRGGFDDLRFLVGTSKTLNLSVSFLEDKLATKNLVEKSSGKFWGSWFLMWHDLPNSGIVLWWNMTIPTTVWVVAVGSYGSLSKRKFNHPKLPSSWCIFFRVLLQHLWLL